MTAFKTWTINCDGGVAEGYARAEGCRGWISETPGRGIGDPGRKSEVTAAARGAGWVRRGRVDLCRACGALAAGGAVTG